MKPEIPHEARWDYATEKAQNFIIDSNINKLPVDPFALYKNNNWKLIKLSDLEKSNYSSAEDIAQTIVLFKNDKNHIDALTFNCHNEFYLTIYDDSVSDYRIHWTLGHEIGHIILEHFSFLKTGIKFLDNVLFRSDITNDEYQALEGEAHAFAAELLAPEIVLKNIGAISKDEIQNLCYISNTAAGKRERYLSRYPDHVNIYDDEQSERLEKIYNYFTDYINSLVYCSKNSKIKNDKIYRTHWQLMPKKASHQPSFLSVDNQGRFTACPRCGQKHFSTEANYCKTCGFYLFICNDYDNLPKFKNCGMKNPKDAHYCECCGAITIFNIPDFKSN
jgi:Zn-dependent peptidase ImmA (M78 family)